MVSIKEYPRITISGARGIVGEDLTVENVLRMAWAYARIAEGKKVVVGRDARPTGEMIKNAVLSGLLAGGVTVIDIDKVPTPTIGIMILKHQAAGGIGITASHNPTQWNALKMFGSNGIFPPQSFVDDYIQILSEGDFVHAKWDEVKERIIDDSALDTHCQLVMNAIDPEPVRKAKFKVLVDGCRSVGGIFLPALLEQLGCDVVCYDCEPDGKFTRGLEPVAQHLDDVCKAVKEHGVDVGLVSDPDADRLAIISEKGEAIGEEFTLALSAYGALTPNADQTVVCNLSTSMLTDFAAKQKGGHVIRTPIGEANVAKAIVDHNAVIGGEGSGGVMFPAVHNGRDSMTASALVLSLMAEKGKKVSELAAEFPDYIILKDKIEMDLGKAKTRLEEITKMDLGAEVDTRDGVKITWDNAWLHLRCSNTEPIVRIFAESEGVENTQALVEKGHELMKV